MTARLSNLQPTAVNRVLQEARQLQTGGRSLVSLMRGQPDTPTPAPVVEAAIAALHAGRTGYPDMQGEPDLRRAIAEKLARDNNLAYDPEREILVTTGATEGLAVALAALVEPGDDVLLPDPIYDAYASAIALWGGRPVSIPSTIHEGRFRIERSALEAARTPRARVLLLNTPWNPVGAVMTAGELDDTVDFAAVHGLTVISDEIYENLVYDGRRHISLASRSPEARKSAVLVNSLSKTYAMTGWRVGYCAAPEEITRKMLLLVQQWSRGPALFVQDAAAAALRFPSETIRAMTAAYQGRRDLVVERLRDIPNVVPLVPEGGLFVMVDVRGLGLTSDDVRRYLLREAGVIVIHGAAYGPAGEGTLRVSFAGGGPTLEEGLRRLKDGLTFLARQRKSQ